MQYIRRKENLRHFGVAGQTDRPVSIWSGPLGLTPWDGSPYGRLGHSLSSWRNIARLLCQNWHGVAHRHSTDRTRTNFCLL